MFQKGKVRISLKTQDEWDLFMKWLEEETNIVWNEYETPTMKNRWETHKQNTIIHIWRGQMDYDSSKRYLPGNLIDLSTILKENKMKSLQELINKHGDQEISEEKFMETFGIEVKKHWKPEFDERYWYITDYGHLFLSTWTDHGIDEDRWQYGNVYKTEEEAKFVKDKKRFLTKMERDFEDNSEPIDWDNLEQWKWYVRFDYGEQMVLIDATARSKASDLVTTNREWLKQYIKDNEANIKKYVLGVRE